MSKTDIITQDDHGMPMRWRSPAGVMHAVERTLVGGDPKVFTSKTRCGRVVDNAETWVGKDTLACQPCFDAEHADRMAHDHAHHDHAHDHGGHGH